MDTFWKHTMLFSDDRSMSKISSYIVTSDCCGKILSMNQQKKIHEGSAFTFEFEVFNFW